MEMLSICFMRYFWLLLQISLAFCSISTKCPCADQTLCDLQSQAGLTKAESFIFAVRAENYKKYDWSRITTLSISGEALQNYTADMMCFAHSKGVRIVPLVDFPKANLTSSADRSRWVAEQVQSVKHNFWDGANLDFEQSIGKDEKEYRDGLTELTKELYIEMKAISNHTQVSFDTPHGPGFGRYYDYAALSRYTDFLFLMDYDENPLPRAGANCHMNRTVWGIQQFEKLGISANKMVAGLPWYGYNYPCDKYLKNNTCYASSGSQMGYSKIVNDYMPMRTTKILWDKLALSPYFSYKNNATGQINQIWYDDPVSLKMKNNLLLKLGLRGVGIWQADTLDYTDSPSAVLQRKKMWMTLPEKEYI